MQLGDEPGHHLHGKRDGGEPHEAEQNDDNVAKCILFGRGCFHSVLVMLQVGAFGTVSAVLIKLVGDRCGE